MNLLTTAKNRFRRLEWSLRYNGMLATGQRFLAKALGVIKLYRVADLCRPKARETRFDEEFGVDTAFFVRKKHLDIHPSRRQQAGRYEPTSAPEFHCVMSKLQIPYERMVFVDYGSGKGRVVMMASTYPFKEVIGIELCPNLHSIAQQNLATFQRSMCRCKDVRCICEDASAYNLPTDPAVLYLFNPFNEHVLVDVVAHICESFRQQPRSLIVIYNNAKHRSVLDKCGCLYQAAIEFDGRWVIYRSVNQV